MKRGYWEEYACGCVSEISKTKKNLMGYCPTHGADRRQLFREDKAAEQALDRLAEALEKALEGLSEKEVARRLEE